MFEFLVFVECSARLLPPEYLGQEAEKKWLTKKRIRIPRSLRSPVHNLRLRRLQHRQSRQHLHRQSRLLRRERLRRLQHHQSRQHLHRQSRLLRRETPASAAPPKAGNTSTAKAACCGGRDSGVCSTTKAGNTSTSEATCCGRRDSTSRETQRPGAGAMVGSACGCAQGKIWRRSL